MDARAYLDQLLADRRQLPAELAMVERIAAECRGMPCPAWAAEYVESVAAGLRADLDALQHRQDDLRRLCAQLPADLAAVLLARYVRGVPWSDVPERLHYSARHAHRLHRRAVAALADLLEGGAGHGAQ